MTSPILFSSPDGEKVVRDILASVLPDFDPHVYQPPGICKILDGVDTIAVTPTGSGKTGFIFMTLLVMKAIAQNASLWPHKAFPDDPVVVVICPTNTIENQMEERMAKIGISALAINAESVAQARKGYPSVDLWQKAREGVSMLLLGPEQLSSQGLIDLLKFPTFYHRVSLLAVDEIHLLVAWGKAFRTAFTQIGFMRQRFPPKIPLIGLTATLRDHDNMSDSIFNLLGVNRGEFYLLKRSNARYDIQILFRTMVSGINGMDFPELDWVTRSQEKTIIFASSINLVFRLKMYLHDLLVNDPHRDTRVQTVHGLNWPDDNEKAISALISDPHCQIIIATNTLAQGTDMPNVQLIIHFGEPESSEMYVQKPGRAGRDPNVVKNPRAIFYISKARMAKAARVVAQTDEQNTADDLKGTKGTAHSAMPRDVAQILVAPCKPAEHDRQFGNLDIVQPVCQCRLCIIHPLAHRPEHCNCSGCQPEDHMECDEIYVPKGKQLKVQLVKDAKKRLTRLMKDHGTRRLREFRLSIWKSTSAQRMTPLSDFLPDVTIQFLLDRFALFHEVADVLAVTQFIAGMKDHESELFSFMKTLGDEMEDVRRRRVEELKVNKEKTAAVRKEGNRNDEESSESDQGSTDEEVPNEVLKIRIRIPVGLQY